MSVFREHSMKVKYLGTGRGQGDVIIIGGYRFERGQSINIAASDVEYLDLDRPGFEVSKPKKSADSEPTSEENILWATESTKE
jgi:hypothetical protein